MTRPLRVGNASGFYGDRFAAVHEMLTGGEARRPHRRLPGRADDAHPRQGPGQGSSAGYAKTFLRQMEESLGLALERGVKIVTNAGGLNPAGLARRLSDLAKSLAVEAEVAHVEGDDLLPRRRGSGSARPSPPTPTSERRESSRLKWRGRRVTGRVTDASLVVGPAAAHFGWAPTDYDALAGATVAGHVVECSAQSTGGNYSFFTEIGDLRRAGFPIAEIHAEGPA